MNICMGLTAAAAAVCFQIKYTNSALLANADTIICILLDKCDARSGCVWTSNVYRWQ